MDEREKRALGDRQPPSPDWCFLCELEGIVAHDEGQSKRDNPYPAGSKAGDFWAEGWHEADVA
jgi:hypothetical protein